MQDTIHRLWKAWPLPLLLLAGCGVGGDAGPVRVTVIGGPPTLADPHRKALDPTQRVLLGAVGESLVTFDESGQIAAGLAQRWIVTSDGLSTIFRLRRASWPDGTAVRSQDVARRMRSLFAPGSRNVLQPAFDSIEEINPTTPEVIEFRLTTPRPPLMELLAQPEAAILSRKRESTGVYRVAGRQADTVRLEPRTPPGEGEAPIPAIELTGTRAARAIASFSARRTDLVLGGTYVDWPLIGFADLQAQAVRVDPADGLFGLVVQRAEGFLAEPANRQVLAMAIDRDAILATLGAQGWTGMVRVLPQRYRSAAQPAFPSWAATDLASRVAEAQRRVAAWQAENEGPVTLRVHLPEGPGSTLLFARLAADWRGVGLDAVRSDARSADLRLIDQIAPAGSAIWYLGQLACPSAEACAEEARTAVNAAREATSLFERGTQLATADRIIAESGLYVPIARPLRWSLVAPRLNLFRENARAWHPLARLIRPRR